MQKKLKKSSGSRTTKWKESAQPEFSPFCYEISMDAQSLTDAKRTLQGGSDLWKVKGFSSWYHRRYFVDSEKLVVVYEGSTKYGCVNSTEMIYIKDIHDVRQGWKTDTFNKIANQVAKRLKKRPMADPAVQKDCCFSIVHGRKFKTLDLVCKDQDVCNAWVRGLSHWVAVQRNAKREDAWKIWLKDQFQKADADRSGGLNFEECKILLHQLNIEMSEVHTRRIFNEANSVKSKINGEDVLDENEFVTFHNLLRKRPELEDVFYKYTSNVALMMPSQLLQFLQEEQNLTHLTIDDATEIIDENEPKERKQNGFMSIDGFRWFLRSKHMDIFNIDHLPIYQNMDQPLTDYFIASSHNTYLIEDQLRGPSSVEGYISALKQGCRCVELDLWDGSDGEPVITHGYTLTSKIFVKDVLLEAIKPYAFAASCYPLILSLENHLGTEQQKVFVTHLKNILGDFLYDKPIDDKMTKWPSPNELKNKIIIKGKKNPGHRHLTVDLTEIDDDSSCCENSQTSPTKKSKLTDEMSNIVNLCQAVPFKDINTTKTKGKFHDCSSLVESKALSLFTSNPVDFVQMSRKQMFRIYPTGVRTDSSNYDPIPMWNAGCQLVALNYQTQDDAMNFNCAKFRGNGHCGLILKPKYLITGDMNFEHNQTFKKRLTIKVISGQHIPKPNQSVVGEIVDPYVVIEVRGHSSDEQSVKTNYVRNNGFNPIWNEKFSFDLRFPELAFVHFVVRDYELAARDEILGQFTIHFNDIQTGYRHVHLVDNEQKILHPATIFVHVSVK